MFIKKQNKIILGLILTLNTAITFADTNSWNYLDQSGVKAAQEGDYSKAETLYSLAISEARRSKSHPGIVLSLFNLGQLCIKEKKYSEAERYFKEALVELKTDKSSKANLAKADFYRILATVYIAQKKYPEAESNLRIALNIYSKYSISQSFNIAETSKGLAGVYLYEHNYTEARPYLVKTLEIYKEKFGKNSPKTIFIQQNMAKLDEVYKQYTAYKTPGSPAYYFHMGLISQKSHKIKEAETYYIKAIDGFKKQKTNDKIYTSSLQNLGVIYLELSKFAEADKLFEEVLLIDEKIYGKQSEEYLAALSNTGLIYTQLARYDKAEELFQKAISIEKNADKIPYKQYLASLSGLCELYRTSNQLEKAEQTCKEAIEIGEKQFGPDYLILSVPISSLGLVYDAQYKWNEAEPLLQRAVKIAKLNKDDINTPRYLMDLGEIYRKTKQFDKAEINYNQANELIQSTLGENNIIYAGILGDLALLYIDQGDYKKAEPFARKSKNIYSNLLDENHPTMAVALKVMAIVDIELGNYEEADNYLKQAYDIITIKFGTNHPQLIEINYFRKKLEEKKLKKTIITLSNIKAFGELYNIRSL